MNYQAMKRHGANLIAYYYMKEGILKSYILHDSNYMIFVLFVYLFLAALVLCGYVWAFSCCKEQGQLFVMMCGLLIVVASLVAKYRL